MANAGEAGTTLLELLVAIALLALLCTYALGALKHLGTFDRVVREIESTNSIAAAAAHLRKAIEGSRVVFVVGANGEEARLAFAGEQNRISFVTGADSRLEYGGLYMVEIGLSEDEAEGRQLVQIRRVFRPSMAPEPGDAEPILLADDIESLGFRYFGSSKEGEPADWHAAWPLANVLPEAIEVTVTFEDDREKWPAMIVTVPAAR